MRHMKRFIMIKKRGKYKNKEVFFMMSEELVSDQKI